MLNPELTYTNFPMMLKAVECNWSLHSAGDWGETEWEIYYDHSYVTKVNFVPDYDREKHEKIYVPPIINTGELDNKTFSDLEALLKTKVWRDPNIHIRAYDGVAWKIDYYSPEGKIVNSSGKLGYIYGEKLLNDIVEIIAQLQVPYGASACVKASKEQDE